MHFNQDAMAVPYRTMLIAALVALPALVAGARSAGAAPSARQYLVYVGTYTKGPSKGIYAYQFDPATGELASLGLAAETSDPSFLTISPNRRFLYAVNEMRKGSRNGGVSAFAIDLKSGKLTFLNEVSSEGRAPCFISMDKTGRYVLVANYGTGSIAVFPVAADGRLEKASAFMQHTGSSVNPARQKGPHAHCVKVSPDNRFVISSDLGLDKLLVARFNATSGTLEPNTPRFGSVVPGSGPRHFAFSPNDKFVYAVSEMGSTLTVFTYNDARGALHRIQTVTTIPKGYSGENDGAEVEMARSGRFVYTSNRGANTIAVFTIDRETGKVSLLEDVSTQGKTPRAFEIDPTGRYLFAANQDSASVVVFRINPRTGRLTPTGQVLQIDSPVCVKFVAR
ncbi:MAG: lactonase family protein [Terriglobia bacterium]